MTGLRQPPSGGCVLKQRRERSHARRYRQPPSGGCVLKPHTAPKYDDLTKQPPSGGCVLKRAGNTCALCAWRAAAAFGRLCVETLARWGGRARCRQPPSGGCVLKPQLGRHRRMRRRAAAFGRLCVETLLVMFMVFSLEQPPSGGCVLKPAGAASPQTPAWGSRLRAAVC